MMSGKEEFSTVVGQHPLLHVPHRKKRRLSRRPQIHFLSNPSPYPVGDDFKSKSNVLLPGCTSARRSVSVALVYFSGVSIRLLDRPPLSAGVLSVAATTTLYFPGASPP
jgi:hypothetical protein